MKYVIAFVATALFLVTSHTRVAIAGPLEEGVSAFSHADYSRALRLLQPLADKGDSDAEYTLALMYVKGDGVPQDNAQAFMLFSLAAKSGDPDAVAQRDQLGGSLTPDEKTKADQLLADWKPK